MSNWFPEWFRQAVERLPMSKPKAYNKLHLYNPYIFQSMYKYIAFFDSLINYI